MMKKRKFIALLLTILFVFGIFCQSGCQSIMKKEESPPTVGKFLWGEKEKEKPKKAKKSWWPFKG